MAHAKVLKAFSSKGEKAWKAKQAVAKLRRHCVPSSSLSHEAKTLQAHWEVTSFFNMHREKEIIKSVQKKYNELYIMKPFFFTRDI